MLVSLIICTRNRADALRLCLEQVARLDFAPAAWELIVVENGSTDNTANVVREFARCVPFRVTLVHEPQPGLGRARNRGVTQAAGDILAFTDDDCYPDPSFLRELLEVYRDEQVGYCGGRVVLHDPEDFPITIKTDLEAGIIPPGSYVPPGMIHGANMSARRTALEAVGGFDPYLGAGTPFACEDVDFIARLSEAGFAGGYFPGPVVRHHHRRRAGPAVERLVAAYQFARGAYHAKFFLRHASRYEYLRHWYWGFKGLLRHRAYRVLRRELAGMTRYAAFRVWGMFAALPERGTGVAGKRMGSVA